MRHVSQLLHMQTQTLPKNKEYAAFALILCKFLKSCSLQFAIQESKEKNEVDIVGFENTSCYGFGFRLCSSTSSFNFSFTFNYLCNEC